MTLSAALLAWAALGGTAIPASDDAHDHEPLLIDVSPEVRTRPRVLASVTGTLDNRAALDLRFDEAAETVFELTSRLDLGLTYDADEHLKLALNARLDHFVVVRRAEGESDTDASELSAELREAYLLWRSAHGLDVAFGNQVFSWGATRLVRPLAVLNAVDYRAGPLALSADPAVPALALTLSLGLGSSRLTFAWLPLFVGHRARLDHGDFALLPSTQRGPTAQPRSRLADAVARARSRDETVDGDAAMRIETHLSGLDLGLQWCWQRDKTPHLDGAGGLAHRRRHLVGADLAWVLADLGFALEVAFHGRRTVYDTTVEVAQWRPALHWALEVEAFAARWLSATLALSHHAILGGDDDQDYYLVDEHEVRLTSMVSVMLAFGGVVALDLEVDYGVARGDLLVASRLRWRATEALALEAGVAVFSGPTGQASLGGLYDPHDYAYLRSTLSF